VGESVREVEPATSVTEVVGLYQRFGTDHYDEDLSQLAHALQTATLARDAGASDELTAAALLHDVGHLLDIRDGNAAGASHDLRHEATGARYLARLYGPAVTGPIALHVRAKRYRCAVDPGYHAALSPASTRSLALQGGPLTAREAATFEAHPSFADAVALRGWDDRGKVDGLAAGTLADLVDLLERTAAYPEGKARP
jgi:phosphonate degradation associated HDIG domain protein